MDYLKLFYGIIFAVFIALQLGSVISTAMLLYYSKKNGGQYCPSTSKFFLVLFWLFTFLVLAAVAVFYVLKVVHDPPMHIIVNNIAVILWTITLIGTIFLSSIIFKANNSCFQMSSLDTSLTTVTLAVTVVVYAMLDYFIGRKLFGRGLY